MKIWMMRRGDMMLDMGLSDVGYVEVGFSTMFLR